MQDPASPIMQGVQFPHEGDHELFTPDPTNPDGSCAHGYLCAYCNAELRASVLAAAVTDFLRSDPDTHLALAHIFEADGEDLRRDIQRVLEQAIENPDRDDEN